MDKRTKSCQNPGVRLILGAAYNREITVLVSAVMFCAAGHLQHEPGREQGKKTISKARAETVSLPLPCSGQMELVAQQIDFQLQSWGGSASATLQLKLFFGVKLPAIFSQH